MRTRLRTPRTIDDSARWTPAPRQSRRYRSVMALVLLVAYAAGVRWGAPVGLVAMTVGSWLVDRLVRREPDLDVEQPHQG
ncbi:hypothetical protein [Pedococcus ginsenosidimutans]|uniref:hypothetical protein n=1 Tax=Pedococcus ginsenosidimutans TaxID=490570 RepID=UPI0031EFC667